MVSTSGNSEKINKKTGENIGIQETQPTFPMDTRDIHVQTVVFPVIPRSISLAQFPDEVGEHPQR